MTLGALTFLSPWLLAGLAALPVIYWLLRTVPPRPRQIRFPATRILAGLKNRESTPDKTPWWLMLIRMLAAALVILALAEPVLNPDRSVSVAGRGPVAIVVDNGWNAAPRWANVQEQLDRLIDDAERQGRSVILVETAGRATGAPARLEAPADVRRRAGALLPQPYAPTRMDVMPALRTALAEQADVSIVWLSDGVDHGEATAFGDALAALSPANLTMFEPGASSSALGLHAGLVSEGRLEARVVRAAGGRREGILHALSQRGERLSEARFAFGEGETELRVAFDLPLELRNQVTRVVISGERSAGAINLLDARSKWNRVGLVSGASQEQSQPLLGPLYYIQRALKPFAEMVVPSAASAGDAIKAALKQNATVLMLADIGTLPGDVMQPLTTWIEKGGVLVRFAGPRLEQGGDELLPVPLRSGGRTLGGALSWSEPQALAALPDDSPFTGLGVAPDVLVNRQVLADPSAMTPATAVWARLADGTPLVTARRRGDGRIVLFHVTANSDWSNLPLSGLFVDMLRRVVTLSSSSALRAGGVSVSDADTATGDKSDSVEASATILAPIQVLDGFGTLGPPPATAKAAPASGFDELLPTVAHPPGYYGAEEGGRALNVIRAETVMTVIGQLPAMVARAAMGGESETDLKPWMLAAALALLFVDIAVIVALQAGGFAALATRTGRATGTAAVVLGALFVLSASYEPVHAQSNQRPSSQAPAARAPAPSGATLLDPSRALAATSRVTFAYVLTGDPGLDGISKAGLEGLVRQLAARTAVEPGPPFSVNIETDEISFFPVLYWPVSEGAKDLSVAASAKLDAYMKRGGMIIFDTRDYGQGMPLGFSQGDRAGQTPLQRMLSKLDIPRLEPVPEGHVLTKSFYLINAFPGRWDGGQLWVEASEPADTGAGRQARRADGVSSILITPNDFASAWATGSDGQPLLPVVPGGERQREWAYRTGINIMMYALTGNYKADQVHIPSLLQRLGQ